MAAQSDPVRLFADAWKDRDDNAIDQLMKEADERGDGDFAAMTRTMLDTPYGGK